MQTIHLGDVGPQVVRLHDLLRRKGFGAGMSASTVTQATLDAIHQFQAAHDLPATGRVDADTWVALQTASPRVDSDGHGAQVERQRAWVAGQIPAELDGQRRRVLEAAVATFGWREDPPGSNGGPQVDRISTGYYPPADEEKGKPPWCALAVCYWLREGLGVGYEQIPFGNRLGGVAQIERWGRRNGRHTELPPIEAIPAGAIFLMRRAGSGSDDADGAGAGHAGLVIRDEGPTVVTIEGNVGDAVWSRRRRKVVLTGFVRWW